MPRGLRNVLELLEGAQHGAQPREALRQILIGSRREADAHVGARLRRRRPQRVADAPCRRSVVVRPHID